MPNATQRGTSSLIGILIEITVERLDNSCKSTMLVFRKGRRIDSLNFLESMNHNKSLFEESMPFRNMGMN